MNTSDLNTTENTVNNSSEPKTTAKHKYILAAMERIVELVEDSNFNDDFKTNAAKYIKYVSRKLCLTPMQSILLAMFVDRSEDSRIHMSELAKYVGCRTTRLLMLADDIDALENKRYIRASRKRNSISYSVPFEVLKALRNDTPYVYTPRKAADTAEFFDIFNSLTAEKNNDELTHDQLREEMMRLLGEIKDTVFARTLSGYNLDSEDTLLFVYMAHLYVRDNDNCIVFGDIENIFDDDNIPYWCRNELLNRESDLFKKNLIQNVNEDGMARSDAFRLTAKAKNELFTELNLKRNVRQDRDLEKAESFPAKHLVYNPTEKAQVGELTAILHNDRFKDVQTRLKEAGMRPGFCCIFYGAPGTGKTETVYQLARATGRDILRVDVDKVKSCWVGESEKKVKALFDRYRDHCRHSDVAPILLFNEADAVLGVRMEGASQAVDKMENSIQNIILQEMEKLDGIMIATTNLTTNLDKAFERRFLYKIRFDKPTVEARAAIWQAMLKGLNDDDARMLATQFDLSGGEIENIVRKHSVNAILTGSDTINIDAITDACRHERLSSNSRPTVGF